MVLALAVLGDSVACGLGAGHADERLVPRLVRHLAQHGFQADARVVAASGARSAHLAGQVERLRAEPPDVAVIVIGANDLRGMVPAETAAAQLDEALARLRAWGCEVVVAPAPDLSAVPRVPRELVPAVQAVSRRLRSLQSATVRRHGGWLVDGDDQTSARFASDRTLFSSDLFHPSSEGYAVIAAALLPVVLQAARRTTAR